VVFAFFINWLKEEVERKTSKTSAVGRVYVQSNLDTFRISGSLSNDCIWGIFLENVKQKALSGLPLCFIAGSYQSAQKIMTC
jgi:hypothetical protein